MVDEAGKATITVCKTNSKSESDNKGTKISVPPLEIDIVYETNFESKPLWNISKTGFWDKDTEGEWTKENFVASKIKGVFVENKAAETKEGVKYVLITHENQEKWVCIGSLKPGKECIFDKKKNKCTCEYFSEYRNLAGEYAYLFGPQYGIRGKAEVKYNEVTLKFRLIGVTHKAHQNMDKEPAAFTQIGAGRYKGMVNARGKYITKYGDKGLLNSLSIWFWKRWDENTCEWKDNPKTKNCFIHPAHYPWLLEGCLALGNNHSDYGFESAKDSCDAMKAVFNLIGISTDEQFVKAQKQGVKVPIIITITDNRAIAVINNIELVQNE